MVGRHASGRRGGALVAGAAPLMTDPGRAGDYDEVRSPLLWRERVEVSARALLRARLAA